MRIGSNVLGLGLAAGMAVGGLGACDNKQSGGGSVDNALVEKLITEVRADDSTRWAGKMDSTNKYWLGRTDTLLAITSEEARKEGRQAALDSIAKLPPAKPTHLSYTIYWKKPESSAVKRADSIKTIDTVSRQSFEEGLKAGKMLSAPETRTMDDSLKAAATVTETAVTDTAKARKGVADSLKAGKEAVIASLKKVAISVPDTAKAGTAAVADSTEVASKVLTMGQKFLVSALADTTRLVK